MALQKPASPFGRYRWRWMLVAIGFASWISLGCNPSTLSFLAMPWVDDKVEPAYKLFAEDKEVKLVILSNFAHPQLDPDLMPAEMELAEKVATAIRERCSANKHKLKIVPYAEARSLQIKQQVEGNPSPLEVGKKLKADFVLDLNIQSFSLYEKRSNPPLFRGEADITINLFKVDVKDSDHNVFSKSYRGEGSPTPFDGGNTRPATFRAGFLSKMSRDIAKMFIAYPNTERGPFEDRGSSMFSNR